ncbi:MAG: hypothetical protein R6X17_00920 [Candidatus Competibacteraceae bacterium]
MLVVAVLISLLWALRASYYAAAQAVGLDWLYQLLEVARNVAWLLFLVHLLEPLVREMGAGRWLRWAGPALIGCGVLAIAGLALIEQLFRNRPPRGMPAWASQ